MGAGSGFTTGFATPALGQPILDPEIQAFVDDLEPCTGPPTHLLSPLQLQDRLEKIQAGSCAPLPASVEDMVLSLPVGPVPIRIVRAEGANGPLPIIVYLHGGGWISGGYASHDRLVRELAIGARAAVVVVQYSTDPSVCFPVQNEQAYSVLCHLVDNSAALGLDGDRVALAGDGSGGTMAAALTLTAKRRRGPAIALQLLLYPALSLPDETASYAEFAEGPWLTADDMRRYLTLQFPIGVHGDPEALPGCASRSMLEGLPPAVVITAESDVLRDDGEAYARKLLRAGVPVTATRYIGAIHDFMMLDRLADAAPSRAAVLQACNALRMALHP